MFIRLLGQVGAGQDEDHVVPVTERVTATILAHLAMAAGKSVAAEALIDDLWPTPTRTSRNAVQVAINKLRKQLGPNLILSDRAGYRLRMDLTRVDFAEACDYARAVQRDLARMDDLRALNETERALELFIGVPFAGLKSDSLENLRTRAEETRSALSVAQAKCLIRLGRSADAVALLRREWRRDVLSEAAPTLLMEALARDGRTAEALAVFDGLRHSLADELGVDPSAATTTMFQRVLSNGFAPLPEQSSATGSSVTFTRPAFPLVGRQTEIADLFYLFHTGHRLVTIVGQGGIGKTRLAIAVAQRMTDDLDRPAVVVDLTLARESADVSIQAMSTLDPRGVGLSLSLRDTHSFVLIDNAEHVIGAVIDLTRDLLALSGVDILLTSRSPLRLNDERVYELDTLESEGPQSPSLMILTARAALSRDQIAAQPDSLQQLAAKADGVPLVLEIFASSLRWRSASQLLADINNDYTSMQIVDGALDRPARHRSVGAAIEWGIIHTRQGTRQCLGALTTITGKFDMSAATAVIKAIDSTIDPRAVIMDLLDVSLVASVKEPGQVQFRILEPVRQEIQHSKHVGRVANAVHLAHSLHYLDLIDYADKASVETICELNALIAIDQGNFARAITWLWDFDPDLAATKLPALLFYWYYNGPQEYLNSWVTAVLNSTYGTAADRCRVATVRLLAIIWYRNTEAHELELIESIVSLPDPQLDVQWLFRLQRARASWESRLGRHQKAIALIENAKPTGRRDSAIHRLNQAECYWYAGDLDRARSSLGKITHELPDAQDSHLHLSVLAQHFFMSLDEGDAESASLACARYRQTVERYDLRDNFLTSDILAAWKELQSGSHDRALVRIDRALENKYLEAQPHELLELLTIAGLSLAGRGDEERSESVALCAARLRTIHPGAMNPFSQAALQRLTMGANVFADGGRVTNLSAITELRSVLDEIIIPAD